MGVGLVSHYCSSTTGLPSTSPSSGLGQPCHIPLHLPCAPHCADGRCSGGSGGGSNVGGSGGSEERGGGAGGGGILDPATGSCIGTISRALGRILVITNTTSARSLLVTSQ